MFHEDQIVFRIGALTDPHISYENYTGQMVADAAARYTAAMAAFKKVSGNRLDGIISMGDYTSIGSKEQVESFISVEKAVMKDLFADAPTKPKHAIGYGNHDTCWGVEEDYYLGVPGWEALYRPSGLLDDYEADSAFGEGGGNYHVKLEKDGHTFHLLALEIDYYHANAHYSEERLAWIDAMLDKLTKEEPNAYLLVGAHSPIRESGVYGVDMDLERMADWAKSELGGIHEVVKKYPQVIFLSGHTHLTNYFETSIMQKDYTAINVAGSYWHSLWGGACPYLDDMFSEEHTGMAMYFEVDANGNIRITRLNLTEATVRTENEFISFDNIPNPNKKSREQYPFIGKIEMTACRYVDGDVPTYGDPWILEAPKPDGSHLAPYSAKRGEVPAPEFGEGQFGIENVTEENGKTSFDLSFPAAERKAGLVHHYIINLFDESHHLVKEYWAAGDWCDVTTGVVDGKTHRDAKQFCYRVETENLGPVFTAELTPMDEYKNCGKTVILSSR